MISLTSNLSQVIGQVTALRDEVPRAVQRALAPAQWIEIARETAEKTIRLMATADEEKYVTAFVGKVTSGPLAGGIGFVLGLDASTDRRRFGFEQDLSGNTYGAMQLLDISTAEFMDTLRRWVATPELEGGKRRDERDAEKTDEEIVEHLWKVLFLPASNPEIDEARAGLLPHIVAFHQKEMQSFELSPERIDEWLRAVLAAWRSLVRSQITARIRAELKAKKFP